MTELENLVDKYLFGEEFELSDTIRNYLLDGDEHEILQIMQDIARNRTSEFNDILIEVMYSDMHASCRSMSFWALCLVSDISIADDLLESIAIEDDSDAKLSMIDSFVYFAQLHKIPPENILIDSDTPEEHGLLHKTPEYRYKVPLDDQPDEIAITPYKNSNEAITEARVRIKQIMLELHSNIPISLRRMSEVAGVTGSSLDRYLKELSESGEMTGIYYPLEQVFIKQQHTVREILNHDLPLDRKEKTPECPNCGGLSLKFPCIHCEGGMQCSVCKLMLGANEVMSHCPHCDATAHGKHLKEWLKIKGVCPICKKRIVTDELL